MCYVHFPLDLHPIQFINETESTVLVYQANGLRSQRILTIEPHKSACYYDVPMNHSRTFVFSTGDWAPLIGCKQSAELLPMRYCFDVADEELRQSWDSSPLSARILLPPEPTLKRLCLETIAQRVLKSKSTLERLPIPKRLKNHFAIKPSSKVEKLCLPRGLKEELRVLVEHPPDYARAKRLIDDCDDWIILCR